MAEAPNLFEKFNQRAVTSIAPTGADPVVPSSRFSRFQTARPGAGIVGATPTPPPIPIDEPTRSGVFGNLSLGRVFERAKRGIPAALGSVASGLGTLVDSITEKIQGPTSLERQARLHDFIIKKNQEEISTGKSFKFIDGSLQEVDLTPEELETKKTGINSSTTEFTKLTNRIAEQKPEFSDFLRGKGAELQTKSGQLQQEFLTEFGEPTTKPQRFVESAASSLPGFIGNFGLTALTLAVTRNPTLATSVGLSSTYLQEAGFAYQEAIDGGADEELAETVAGVVGTANSILEIAPIFQFLNDIPVGNKIKNKILRKVAIIAAETSKQALTEAPTEAVQEMVGNAAATVYDEDRDLFEGVEEAFFAGGFLGAGAGGVNTTLQSTAPLNVVEDQLKENVADAFNTPEEQRTPEQKEIVTAMTSEVVSPSEAVSIANQENITDTPLGTEIRKVASTAKSNNQDVSIAMTEDGGSLNVLPAPKKDFNSLADIIKERGLNISPPAEVDVAVQDAEITSAENIAQDSESVEEFVTKLAEQDIEVTDPVEIFNRVKQPTPELPAPGTDIAQPTAPIESTPPPRGAELSDKVDQLGVPLSVEDANARPVGTGKTEISRLQQRVQDQLLEADPDRYEFNSENASYNTLNLRQDAEKAIELLENDPEMATAVALGHRNPPPGQSENNIAVAVALQAREEGNIRLWNEIMNHISLKNTRRGQEIVALRGKFNKDSPENYVKEIIDIKTKTLARDLVSKASKDLKKSLKNMSSAEVVQQEIKKRTTKLQEKINKDQSKISLAQDIIDQLTC